MNDDRIWKIQVPQEMNGKRMDRVITELGHTLNGVSLSRAQVQKWMDEGRIRIDGVAIKSGQLAKNGTVVEVHVPLPKKIDVSPIDLPLDILYQDSHLAIINKPAGISVHPSDTDSGPTLVHALLFHIQDLSGIGGKLRPGIVHRLDKFTSGTLIIAKNDAAHRKLVEIFSAHQLERRYWALCWSAWNEDQVLRIETTLGRDPANRTRMAPNVSPGRTAISYFKTRERYRLSKDTAAFASWIEAQLETGRTHQVRAHLKMLGHPAFGDSIYGGVPKTASRWATLPTEVADQVRSLAGQALHAYSIRLKHPMTGKILEIQAPPPPAFSLLLETLKAYL